jgi:hypothetical protein
MGKFLHGETAPRLSFLRARMRRGQSSPREKIRIGDQPPFIYGSIGFDSPSSVLTMTRPVASSGFSDQISAQGPYTGAQSGTSKGIASDNGAE